jgi:hypothetical protein
MKTQQLTAAEILISDQTNSTSLTHTSKPFSKTTPNNLYKPKKTPKKLHPLLKNSQLPPPQFSPKYSTLMTKAARLRKTCQKDHKKLIKQIFNSEKKFPEFGKNGRKAKKIAPGCARCGKGAVYGPPFLSYGKPKSMQKRRKRVASRNNERYIYSRKRDYVTLDMRELSNSTRYNSLYREHRKRRKRLREELGKSGGERSFRLSTQGWRGEELRATSVQLLNKKMRRITGGGKGVSVREKVMRKKRSRVVVGPYLKNGDVEWLRRSIKRERKRERSRYRK